MITRHRHHILAIFLKAVMSLASGLWVCALPSFAADSGHRPPPETGQQTSVTGSPVDNATDPMSQIHSTQDSANEPPPLSEEQKNGRSFLTGFEQWLTLVILLFGALVLLAEYLLLRQTQKTSYELMQLFAVNLIITGTLVLISAGYSASQIAPALGLFGTIAGYLLGRRSNNDEAPKDNESPKRNTDQKDKDKETI